MLRVVLADDQDLFRAGFATILGAEPDIEVVAEAADGAAAVRAAVEHAPDVVLMDMRMPILDGVAATRQVCERTVSRVLALTMFDTDEYLYAVLRAGASGFLLKDVPRAELVRAVRVVAGGEALLAPAVTARVLGELHRRGRPDPALAAAVTGLTARETDVLRLIAGGLSNAEIAAHHHLSEHTVKTHVGNLFAKLGLRDRAQAVMVAYESGLVTPGSP
ncbi:DNA-binding NarL/FixJ family response regulator [Actinoplanes octamycinicus]|uniref:DNA-binding NarL/FixJ family response regulator n=1 Tax=Actinoplanes octamycinicus TaxID=135948 RepID=A0A7W7H4T3_9ACTN|nr:response regulator transcription factor [Actinoplanes octamycinicus]MBB4743647.1 DNA-binding NarL/FixJ family response regulator [Actinoplanes octamycinicus]GIE61072.1 DNA-binding response regulator [Actinoplanes octamycinicus]